MTEKAKLMKEYRYFVDHIDELVEKWRDKIIVIRGEQVVGVYDDYLSAYADAVKKYPPGTFMLQLCTDDPSKLVSVYYSPMLHAA